MKHFIIIGILVFMSGCATIPPSKGIYAGNLEHHEGNYEQAILHYKSALELAEQQNYKPHIATANYGIGRAYGQLCKFKLAEKHLKEAVALEELISDGKGPNLSQDYFELARLYYDFSKYNESIVYFQKAVPLAESLGIMLTDPIGYANVLNDYETALRINGMLDEYKRIKSQINILRATNPTKKSKFIITRYNTSCMLNN